MNLKQTLRIAKWEVEHQLSGSNRKQILIVLLVLALAGGLFAFGGADNTNVEEDLYAVGVFEDSPYFDIVEESDELVAVSLGETYVSQQQFDSSRIESGELDLIIHGNGIVNYRPNDEQSEAALAHTNNAIDEFNQNQLMNADAPMAAFPVLATVVYQEQTVAPESASIDPRDEDDIATETSDDSETTDSQHDETTNDFDGEGTDDFSDTNADSNEELGLQTPGNIQPPFPFEAVLLGFLFLIPMNFIVQAYSSSVLDERIDYSGELLLVAPISQFDIIIGKTLPYALALFGITCGLAAALGTSAASVFAVMATSVAFLSAGFITGIFARSYRELTFVFLTLSVLIFSFVLIPAIFTTVHPIAIISPLTVVVAELQGEALPLIDIAFATIPILMTGIILFVYGAGIYREEDLFTQRPVPQKVLDMLSQQVASWKSLFLIGMIILPFVFAAQLLLIATLFALPQSLALPIIIILAAFIEELAKSLPVYAGVVNDTLSDRRTQLLAAAASGIGFFLAEQVTTVAQLVGLLELELGAAILGGAVGQITGTPIGLALPVMWIAIHPVATMISTSGMNRGRYGYLIALIAATLVHVLYNAGVMLYA